MRLKFIIPFPFDDEGIANHAAQIPRELFGPATEVECVSLAGAGAAV